MKFSLRKLFFCLAFCAAPAAAQEEGEADYQKLMEQMMKSGGNYSQAQAQAWDARLKVVSGTVMIKEGEADEWAKVTGEVPLDSGDMIKTAGDAVSELYLDDKAAISLGRNTELELSSMQHDHTIISVVFGSLSAKVKPLLNRKNKFEVRTPSAVCAIRGTEFAVEYSQLGKESMAAVFDEGRVAASLAEAGGGEPQEYLLEKNMEIVFNPAQKRFRPTAVSRMARHRSAVMNMRKRVAALKGWRPRPAAKRAALRERALTGNVVRRQLKDGKTRTKAVKPLKKRVAPRGGTKSRSRKEE